LHWLTGSQGSAVAQVFGLAPLLTCGLSVGPPTYRAASTGSAVTPSSRLRRPGAPLRLQSGSLRHHAELEEASQPDQQLSREGDNPDLASSRSAAAEPRLIPPTQPAPRLIPQPAPRQVDGDGAEVPTPRLQCSRKRRRCQRRTVSGVTIMRDCLHPAQIRASQTQKRRSVGRSLGRVAVLLYTPRWWRKARFSRGQLAMASAEEGEEAE
jgi:hypothetical protein